MIKDGATRDGYGEALVELGNSDPNVVVLDSGVSDSTRTIKFGQKFPERFFNMGISEADMVCTAAGLARTGKVAFATSFACFLLGRTMDQILVSIAYSNSNVKLAGTHTGLAVGEDGPSAQMIVDLAYTRAMPNMIVIQPADWEEAVQATKALSKYFGPAYLRLGRPKLKGIYDSTYKFEIGKGNIIRQGSDAVIFAYGPIMLPQAYIAAEKLESEYSISVKVVNIPWLNTINKTWLKEIIGNIKQIYTLDNHLMSGGQGEKIGSVIAQLGLDNISLKMLGLTGIPVCGLNDEVIVYYELDTNSIVKVIANSHSSIRQV